MKLYTKKQKQALEDIYDVIARTQFEGEARKGLHKFTKGKNIEWSGDTNTITIGKRFIIKLV